MELIRGPKPLTEVERAFAAAAHKFLKQELQLGLVRHAYYAADPIVADSRRPPRPIVERPIAPPGMKYCPTCTTIKSHCAFSPSRNPRSGSDGYFHICKECKNLFASKAYRTRYGGRFGRLLPENPAQKDPRAAYFQPGRA